MEMTCVSLGNNTVKVTLTGRLDTPGTDRIEKQFYASFVPGRHNAVIDLSAVDFVSSMGVRMLIAAARGVRAHRARMALFGAQPLVAEVLAHVSLDQLIDICADEATALAAVIAW